MTSDTLFRERQRVPWLGALFAGVVSGALGIVGIAIDGATGGRWFDQGAYIIICATAAFGALLGLTSFRRIRLESDGLWVGRKMIPLEAVTQTGILGGHDCGACATGFCCRAIGDLRSYSQARSPGSERHLRAAICSRLTRFEPAIAARRDKGQPSSF